MGTVFLRCFASSFFLLFKLFFVVVFWYIFVVVVDTPLKTEILAIAR